MASDPAELQQDAPPEAKSALAPLAGSRTQSLQRLQIGLFGLAAMVLLVGLANIILTNAKENQARVVPEAAATVAADQAAAGSDPLAAAGVVPDEPEAEASNAAPAPQR
jgi:hypothetical protein